ncbi:MAG TPA: HNH endonuclease signature motif containing protein [Bryobacteraceae bacterium]
MNIVICRRSLFRRQFHIEHIIAKQHGGKTQQDNLALACWYCNLKKGPNLTGIDPDSGTVVALFHPRNDRWSDHFALTVATGNPSALDVKGLTPTGRATVHVLGINEKMRCILRYELWREGIFA